MGDERQVYCWICRRTMPASQATFVQIEDDGCGEYECRDRIGCYFATEEQRWALQNPS